MEQLLDLSIIFTPPPQSSPPEVIAAIGLCCDPLGVAHVGDLLVDPLREQDREDLRWYLEEYWKWPYEGFVVRSKQTEALIVEVGKRLYHTVFGSQMAHDIMQTWRLHPVIKHQISIISNIPRALSLPWELLHDEEDFLILHSPHPIAIVRRLAQQELATHSTAFEPPLRVLLVTARPDDVGFIDPRSIARELLDEVQEQIDAGTTELEFLRPPTFSALRARLKEAQRPIQVLHFDGHGTFDEQDKQGKLVFENGEGKHDLVKAADLAQSLRDSSIQLVALTACQSAVGTADDAFSSVAAQLIQGGIDAVVAMSANVLVASATRYVETFYHALVAGTPVSMAQEQARKSLYHDPQRHPHRRRADEEGQPVKLRDWWVPHYYQQRPLLLRPAKPVHDLKKAQSSTPIPRLSEQMPAEPRYGFSGRSRELLRLERLLLRGKVVAISGFGGVGKTALVREAADWLTRTGMFTGACFVSFEHGGDTAWLLSVLGYYLNVYDSHYDPNDTQEALARLRLVLRERHVLVIADNLESILPGGEALLNVEERKHLWNTLLKLKSMNVGILLTSRDRAFSDEWSTSDEEITFITMGGLHSEESYALASRLLDDLRIDRSCVPYGELRDLLAQLDHHPLAIQLVLPSLRDLPLTTIRADFVTLLPQFVDDVEEGRNRSLWASLDYSLQRLSKSQRALLPRLALFENGAMEPMLLEITEIAKTEWAGLRLMLEQTALLTVERLHRSLPIPYLHFHPVLTPFLRSQLEHDNAVLRERFVWYYHALAGYLYRENTIDPQPVHAQVRWELPNLRRALELLLEMQELDAASAMAAILSSFLNSFGLGRQGDMLLQRVEEAAAAAGARARSSLTTAELMRETSLGEREFRKGNLQAAHTRFTHLLERIEARPEGTSSKADWYGRGQIRFWSRVSETQTVDISLPYTPLSQGSYEHCQVLFWLGRCLIALGQANNAEQHLRRALTMNDALLRQQPDYQSFSLGRIGLLNELGDALFIQGRYQQARSVYVESLNLAIKQGDKRSQAAALRQLGALALEQEEYGEARLRYRAALNTFRLLKDPTEVSITLHQLGLVAQRQEQWTEAESYYRESLTISERLNDAESAAKTCNNLARVAFAMSHYTETESWLKHALELNTQVNPHSSSQSDYLNNFAVLLVGQVQAGHVSSARLAEARGYAEQALAIDETLDEAPRIWTSLNLLAEIAEMQGRAEVAHVYRRRERGTFAAFAGNRYQIDRRYGQMITDIAAAIKGDSQAEKRVKQILLQLREEAMGRSLAAAIERMLMGERDWDGLTENLSRESALLVLRVLETVRSPTRQ